MIAQALPVRVLTCRQYMYNGHLVCMRRSDTDQAHAEHKSRQTDPTSLYSTSSGMFKGFTAAPPSLVPRHDFLTHRRRLICNDQRTSNTMAVSRPMASCPDRPPFAVTSDVTADCAENLSVSRPSLASAHLGDLNLPDWQYQEYLGTAYTSSSPDEFPVYATDP